MPTNWDTIPALKIITAENITDAINDFKLVPRENASSMGAPKRAMSMTRMAGTFWFDTSNAYYNAKFVSASNPTGLQLVARQDITPFRPNIGLEARTISTSSYAALNNFDKANFSSAGYKVSQNSSGSLGSQASNYIIANQFYYAFHFTNTGTIVTQGNVVFVITIPNGLSCVLSGGQPIVSHLRGGSVITPSVAPTLVGNTLTITITAATNPYNISTNPAAYHISVLMTSYLNSGWDNGSPPPAIVYLPTVSSAYYAVNSPLSSDFYISLNYASLTITKTNPYPTTITFNQEFDYSIVISNSSTVSATGVVFTDVLPIGVTFVSIAEIPSGWTASISGQTVTVNANANSVVYQGSYPIKIRVRATGENTNISNTASVSGTNSFATSATKANYIDFKRTPTLASQGYFTCSSGVTYEVFRDTNVNSTTYNNYYVNNVNVGATAPSNGACTFVGNATTTRQSVGTKNNCTNNCYPTTSVAGSTVYLNQAGYPSYTTTGTYTSSISQADANYQAQVISDNAYNAGLQAKFNAEGFCTWTASNVAGNYNANFTRNNCGANCYGNGTVNYASPTQYASAVSTTSCEEAVSTAATAAYNMAVANVNTNGQNFANANGTCCCFVADPTCSGCNYLGNRERNTCDNSYRNTTPTEYNSCGCNQNCQGTYYTDYYCNNRDKVYVQKYNCNGVATGATNRVNCGCDAGSQELSPTGYDTCVGCTTFTVYYDGNRCSGTGGQYIVNGGSVGTTEPSRGGCNTNSSYGISRGVRCFNGTNYNVYEDANGCGGGEQYQYRNGADEVQFTSNEFGGDPCTFYAYRSQNFTRNNCGAGYTGGVVNYSNTYSYTGILNQAGANATADANFNNDGQNYANAVGSCTAIQVCKVYDIVAYGDGYYVDGYYTYCNGGLGYFSFYANSSGVIGQTPCVNQYSVVITDYGNGANVQEAYGC
jgi:uncharacterized repeat protein (TIGR01451 family)